MQPVIGVVIVEKMHLPTLGLGRRKFYSCTAIEKK
jgi:hypothetical protein